MPRLLSSLLLLGLALVAGSALAAAPRGEPVAHVVGIEGRATASFPGEPERVLTCDDPVYADERLETAPGARLVVAHQGRHLHLAPEALLVLRRVSPEQTLIVLVHGAVRVLDTESVASQVAVPGGIAAYPAADLEIRRLGSGGLRICDWASTRPGACRIVEPSGAVHGLVEEGPTVDLAIGQLCEWRHPWAVAAYDFASTPPVAAGPPPAFEPEFDGPDSGCQGDECGGSPPTFVPPDIEYTIEQPPIFIPFP